MQLIECILAIMNALEQRLMAINVDALMKIGLVGLHWYMSLALLLGHPSSFLSTIDVHVVHLQPII